MRGQAFTLAGVRIRRGEWLVCSLADVGADADRGPARHADPDRFDPQQPAFDHMAFGAVCISAWAGA
ncbi:hypothetical protein [Streptomyces sp. CG 926]|uniref:hypothetical protein n=1 Tax=Streptomyces sp. CG 926 TaxID=1882405 RepID=UPI000D6D0A53|nr:hypothetical protein [Streptomyces sp. CG 926]